MSAISLQSALELHQAGKLAEAETMYRQILAHRPDNPDALHLLGVLSGQRGQVELAAELIQRAITINPHIYHYYNNLSQMLHGCGRFEQAAAACLKAIQLKGDYVEAHYNLGNALKELGQYSQAVASYQKAISLRPELVLAYNNMGTALAALGRHDAAAAAYSKAIEIKPTYADAYHNLANVHKDQGQLDKAVSWCDKAMEINPADSELEQNRLYLLHFHPDYDAAAIRKSQESWSRRHAAPLAKQIRPHTNDRYLKRRPRIGYVSPYFRHHVVGYNLFPLLSRHDHAQFEIHCFSSIPWPDALTAQFQKFADRWHNVAALSDGDLADLIRKQRIDILVDLSLHMNGTRLLTFARKPAPIQVTFAGYPAGTGLQTIDYRLTDAHLDPPGISDGDYVEESIRLDDCFWCYDPQAMSMGLISPVQPKPLPARHKGHITFGCFNNFCKVNNRTLEVWARVLQATPRSELLLMAPAGAARQRVVETLGKRGVLPTRLRFVTQLPRQTYFELYNEIDLALDTLPYNGHTTSLDAMWMGVAVPTLVGQTSVGRAGMSQLANLDLLDLVARTEDEYIELTAKLAGDLDRLEFLRSTLRQRMLDSPLTNAEKFAKNVESAYSRMWARWCQKEERPVSAPTF